MMKDAEAILKDFPSIMLQPAPPVVWKTVTEPSYFSTAHSGNIFVSRNVITVREHMEVCLGVS